MTRTRSTGLLATAVLLFGGVLNPAIAQDLFAQIDITFDVGGEETEGCSILRVSPTGTLSEFVSNSDILALSGDTECNVGDTGMAIAPDGTLYFNEDVSDQIYQVTPAGVVSVFVTSATLDAAVLTTNDIDNGMTFGSDGNLYAADEDCDCIIRITVPGGVVTVVVPETDITGATGAGEADLEGGLARAADGTLYFVDDEAEAVLRVTPANVVSILATEADITAVTGNPSADLDVGIALVGNNLFVMDDGAGDLDSILRIDVTTDTVTLVTNETAMGPVTGNIGDNPIDLEGGIAINPVTGDLFIGDDGEDNGEDRANILRVTQAGTPSLFVSDAEITAFYEPIYGATSDFRLQGSMAFGAGSPVAVPVMSHWALILMSLAAMMMGGRVMSRRRAV